MALFGKKKSEAPAASSTSTAPASTTPAPDSAFDFDAISRDLDAQNGASSFDALLAQPANPDTTPTGAAPTGATPTGATPPGATPPGATPPVPVPTDSAFDLGEPDPLQMTPTAPVRAQVHTVSIDPEPVPPVSQPAPAHQVTVVTTHTEPIQPIAPPPTSVVDEPLSPAPVVLDTTPETSVQVPPGRVRPVIKPKKSLPIVPILGGLGVLAILGAGAMFLRNSQQEPLDSPAPAPRPRPRVAAAPPVAPSQAPRAATERPQPTGIASTPALRSGSPGIAPPVPATRPGLASRPKGASQIPVGTAQNPTAPRAMGGIFDSPAKGPSATAGLDVGLASHLKALWRAGADAKHRHKYKEARDSWEEALRLRPGHPGFAQAIAKLPR